MYVELKKTYTKTGHFDVTNIMLLISTHHHIDVFKFQIYRFKLELKMEHFD